MTSKGKLDLSEIYYNLTDALRAKENQIQIFKYLISFLFYNFFLNGHTWENIDSSLQQIYKTVSKIK